MNRGPMIAATLLLLTGCGGGFQPDMAAMEDQLREELADQIGANPERLSVECPSSIEWSAGDDFKCFAEDKRGNRVGITVSMQNDEGEFAWETS